LIHFSLLSINIGLPALMAASSGANGENPAAIKSALIKVVQCASLGKNSRANVVFPAPLGPAMIMIFFQQNSCKYQIVYPRRITTHF